MYASGTKWPDLVLALGAKLRSLQMCHGDVIEKLEGHKRFLLAVEASARDTFHNAADFRVLAED